MIFFNKNTKDYILYVTQDFRYEAGIDWNLYTLEKRRQKMILRAILIILKINKNIAITEEEKKFLEQYPLLYDAKKEVKVAIYNMARRISKDIDLEVEKKHNLLLQAYKNNDHLSSKVIRSYADYRYILSKYLEHLKYAELFKKEVIFDFLDDGAIDIKKDCKINEVKIRFLNKKKKN